MSPAVGVSPLIPAYGALPSFVVSPSGLRLMVSRGRQIVPCTSAYAHSAPPGGRLPKRSGSVTVANCLSALQAPPTPRLTLHSDFYAPKEGAPSGLHFTQSRHTSDIPPALHRDYTLSTRYTGRRGASKVVSIVDPPGRWKSARFTHTFLRPPSDCLHPRSSEVSWVVGCALLHLRLTTATDCRHKDCALRLVSTCSPTPLLRHGVGRVAYDCGLKLFALNSPRFIPTPTLRCSALRVSGAFRAQVGRQPPLTFSEPRGQAFTLRPTVGAYRTFSTFHPPDRSR